MSLSGSLALMYGGDLFQHSTHFQYLPVAAAHKCERGCVCVCVTGMMAARSDSGDVTRVYKERKREITRANSTQSETASVTGWPLCFIVTM